jgi:putative flippase GtrA
MFGIAAPESSASIQAMPGLTLPSRDTQARFLRFLVVGGTAAIVDFATFSGARLILPRIATFVLAYLASTTAHYLLNRFWALPSHREDHARQFLEYIGVALLNLGIRYALFWLCRTQLHLGDLLSYAIALPPTTVIVFILLHLRVFRAAPDQAGGR